MILIMDMSGAYGQPIARQIRGQHVYCEVIPPNTSAQDIRARNPRGIVVVGGTADALADDAPRIDAAIYELGTPMLALGYAARAMCRDLGGQLHGVKVFEGVCDVQPGESALFAGVEGGRHVVERADALTPPPGFQAIGDIQGVPAAFADEARGLYALQFVPESGDQDGFRMLRNFTIDISGCEATWTMERFVESQVQAIRDTVGDGRVLCAISGGVDSTICAAIVHRAVGEQLHCIYVDTGLMRKNESDEVERLFRDQMNANIVRVDAQDRFLEKLAGVIDPEQKRKIVGEEFIRVFEEEAKRIGKVDYLVQGTIYPDIIESGIGGAVIKSHHNVGGLPDVIEFREILEPVRTLFKDEVREAGTVLGLPEEMVWRQPFPGPGLSVRCLGEVTKERLDILRDADAIFREEIGRAGLARTIWQYFVVLTDLRSTGVRRTKGLGDERSYEYTAALRAIHSKDAMTAKAVQLPWDLVQRVVERITSEVRGINRVVWDVTGKPPATIEWE